MLRSTHCCEGFPFPSTPAHEPGARSPIDVVRGGQQKCPSPSGSSHKSPHQRFAGTPAIGTCSWQPWLLHASTAHLCRKRPRPEPFPTLPAKHSNCLGAQVSSATVFQKPLYMCVLHLSWFGVSTGIHTINGLALLTRCDILAPGLLVSSIFGILALEDRQSASINSSLSPGFWPHQRPGALLGSCCLVAKILGANPSSHFPEWWGIVNDHKPLKTYMLRSVQHHVKTILI